MSGKLIIKRFLLAVTAVMMISWLPSSAHAVFDSGSTGADGEFAPTASATVDQYVALNESDSWSFAVTLAE